MSGTEQFFFLVVVPAVIVALVWALASIGGPRSQKRYRPGRPYQLSPVWYVANHRGSPRNAGEGGEASHRELTGGAGAQASRRELTAAGEPGSGEPAGGVVQGTTGGASDRW